MKSIITDENNINDIISCPNKYKDATLLIDGTILKDGRRRIVRQVALLLMYKNRIPLHITISNPLIVTSFIAQLMGTLSPSKRN